MPWKEKTVEESREEFIMAAKSKEESFSVLCRKYGISRKTGYKWFKRYEIGEPLSNQSKAPFHMPNRTCAETESLILHLRSEHQSWGPRKLKRCLEDQGNTELPAVSTICDILTRNHCISKTESFAHTPYQRFEKEYPNELWQTDFKGDFAMLNGQRCYPLTVLDDHSRFSLCIDAKENLQGVGVFASFERLFQTYGIPKSILCDNGNPWGTAQRTGYTKFEVWLMELGILPIHGRPMHPQTQGKEERFHRTMKEELLRNVRIDDMETAQRQFDGFRESYNNERPHAALNYDVPAKHYQASTTRMPKTNAEWEYPKEYGTRVIDNRGYVVCGKHRYFLSEAFIGKVIGLRESSKPGYINLYYRDFWIGKINLEEQLFVSKHIYRQENDPRPIEPQI
jgi:transposase InsO family protein